MTGCYFLVVYIFNFMQQQTVILESDSSTAMSEILDETTVDIGDFLEAFDNFERPCPRVKIRSLISFSYFFLSIGFLTPGL